MSHILLFETKKDQVRRLLFLLRLSGHDCTIAYTLEETLNWLKTQHLLEGKIDLVLIGSQVEPPELEVLRREAQEREQIPMVCLQRKHVHAGEQLVAGIEYCQPEDLMTKLNDCLPVARTYLGEQRPPGF